MQILKSPLGIQSPLLGIGASLSPPSLLLQKSSFPALLHGLIKPSTPLESSFSLSRSDFSQLSDGHVTEWNANKPHFEIHSFPQNNTIEVGKFKNNQLAKSSKKRGVTNTDSQSTDELTIQKQSKANNKQTKSKNNQKQSKSKKIASASVSVEKVSQSLKQINSHDSIDSSEKISVNNALGDMTRELVGEFLESSHSTLQQRQTVLRNPVDSEFPSVASSAPVMPLQELESDVTPTREQNILTPHPVVVESPQLVESKTTSGDTTPIHASPQHRELLNLTSTSTPPQNIFPQHPVVVESPQLVESKTTSGDTTPIHASPQHRELLNLTSTSTPRQNILTQHPIVVESPQFVESKTTSGDTTPIQASPQHPQLPNIIPPVLDGSSTLTPPQNFVTTPIHVSPQHRQFPNLTPTPTSLQNIVSNNPVNVESPEFMESKTASGDTTPIPASPQHPQLPNIIPPILDGSSTLTPPPNIFPQHPVVAESPQLVESKTTSNDTIPIQASPQHRELLNLTSTSTPPQNIFPQHPVVVESPQFVESKTTSGDTTPIPASPQHRELLNLTSTSTPPQNILTQHPVVVESPQFVESKTTSGDTTPIPASPQHRELLNLTSTSTPPQNILKQHPVVVESPQFVESKTTSGDTTPIPASPQHPQVPNIIPPVLDSSSTLTPPQNLLTQHPVVVESPQFVESKTTSGDTTPIPASPQHPQVPNIIPPVLDSSSTLTPPQNLLTQHPVVVESTPPQNIFPQHPVVEESPQFVESKTKSGDTTPIPASPQHPQLPNIIPPVLDSSSTLTPPQNLLTQYPVVEESPQFVESKTKSGDTTPIQASPQHRELLNLTSTSTPPQNIFPQHPVVVESPQFVESKTTSGDTTPIPASPQHPQLPNIIPPVLDSSSTLTPPQNLLTQHPVVEESPQFVESKTTSGDTTPIPASPQHPQLPNIIPPVLDSSSTLTPPQNLLTQHPVVEESPQFVESKTKSGDTTPIPASPQHPQLPNIIPPILDGSSTLTPPQNLLTQHPVVEESPQFVESKTKSGDTTPIQASPQHPQLPKVTSTPTPPQNILTHNPILAESPQFVESKTTSGDTTPIQASPQHRELLNLTSTSTPPQNIFPQHPVVEESPQFVESKTTSGDTTPIQASPQHPQLPIIPPVLDGSSTLTPPQNLLTQHPVVVESPQFVESKTTSGDTTPIQASPQHRELLNLTSTSTPPQNLLTQHPVVVESPQFVESKTTSGDTTPIQASPQHRELLNLTSTSTPPQNLLTQHPVVVESPQFVESKTTSGDATPIQASPQHPQLPNIIPPVLDGDRTDILPQDIDLATTSNQVLQTTFKLDDGFNGSTHLQAEAFQKSVQSPPSLINTSNNTSVLNITSDLGVQPTASESLPAVPNPLAYSEVNVNGKNSSNTVDGEMRSHISTSEPGEAVRTINAFINDSTEIKEDLPPPQGYAVGGHVTASNITGTPKVAQSDTVPAMLTPGEFVVNSKDAQKNLNLLKHINSSGIVPDHILTSPPSINKSEEQANAAAVKTSTKVESSKDFPVQRKSSDERVPGTLSSLVSSSPLLKTEKQGLMTLNSLQSNSSEKKTTQLNESSSHYSSTPLIFRKRISTTDSSSYSSNSPSQWTRIEDLVNGSNRTESSQYGFEHQNSASTKWRSPKSSTQNLLQLKSSANGKSANAPDTFTPLQPVTEIIERPSSEPTDTDSDDLETLAREIYHRLRQRLELERERHGSYSGRLPW